MAAGPLTQVSDVIVPEIFTPYVQQISEQKSRIVQSGVLVSDALMNQKVAAGGLTFNMPSQRDLDDDADNVSSDDVADSIAADYGAGTPVTRLDSIPLKVQTDQEIAVRLSRNNSWSTADLASALAGHDPMQGIASRVGNYWARRLQAAFVATINGLIADNVANDGGDYQNDISGGGFIDGVTNISAEAVVDAAVTMGDSMDGLTAMLVHSIVFARMQKNNLIDTIPDARGETLINTFLRREVIVDDGLPNAAGVFDTWLFGSGMALLGTGSPKVPTEVQRYPQAGNGGGQEVLYNRLEWSIHPSGHAYTGTSPNGGPGNGTGANQLNNAGSWNRVWPERKMIKFARLVTRES
jgi:hypothetical protein